MTSTEAEADPPSILWAVRALPGVLCFHYCRKSIVAGSSSQPCRRN